MEWLLSSEFEAKFGMTQAFGCIDGTHIPLKATTVNSQDYYNYKQFYSLNAQEGCDYKGHFTDVACRWLGNCHDVYGDSNINRKMQQKEIPIIYKQKIPGKAKIANYLTGDQPTLWLYFVWKETNLVNLLYKQFFNSMLTEAQNSIECAYGCLKAR